jgi:uncharacterized protein YjbI with pentapeptide repeats
MSRFENSQAVSAITSRYFLGNFIAFSFLFFLLVPSSFAARNHALLIGISQYTELNSLRYADADASEFSQLLTDFAGYNKSEVTLLLNQQATKNRIVDEINKIVRSSQKEPLDTFIMVFAGHGMESTLVGRNEKGSNQERDTNIFLAPSDASTEENNFYSEGVGKQVSNDTFINKAWLARQLSAIKAKSVIIILDSCYSGTRSFGTLYLENEGYAIQSIGPTAGAQRGVAVTQRKLVLSRSEPEEGPIQRKVAYFASSRDDQASAEYEELRHGALSYCILEYIKRVQREVNSDARQTLSIDGAYSNITKLFSETKVKGKALDASHQPLLLSIPNYDGIKDMAFLTVKGLKQRDIQKELAEAEALRKEELRKEELRRDDLRQEELRREALRKDELRKEELRREALRQEELRREALRKDELRKEELRREALRQEELRREELWQESIRKGLILAENIRQEELRKEALRQEDLRKEALRQEDLRKEALRQEELRKEALRLEELRKEALRQEELRREALRQEELRREALRQEELRREALRQEELLKQQLLEGILLITTESVGVELFIDGVKREGVANTSVKLPVGKHFIELYLPSTGYRHSFTADINTLHPVVHTFGIRGEFEVASYLVKDGVKEVGPELDVYIDGISVGKSPLHQKNLLAGTHLVEVRYQNSVKSRRVEIRPDSPLRINYSVIMEAAPKVDKKRVGNVVF